MEEGQSARRSLEAFLAACGVTVRLEETPQDRFAEADPAPAALAEAASTRPVARPAPAREAPSRPVPSRPAPPAVVAPPGETPEGEEAVFVAREAARRAGSLAELRAALAAFEGCPLKATARSTCFGEGPVGAPLMFVGEAPGADEDEAGRPFVGPSGRLLEKMLAAIGFARRDVFISNVIPWRPVANRTPSPIETATCEVFVRREIALVGPKVLVLLGGAAAKTLLRTDISVTRAHGRWWRFRPEEDGDAPEIDAVPTFHPAYLLRTPGEKAKAWRDLLGIRRRLEEVHGLPPLF